MNNIWAYIKAAYTGGALPVLGKGIPPFQVRKRFTIAEVNAGATIVAAPGVGFKVRMIDASMIAIGGNVGAATTVDIIGTLSASTRKLLAVAIAALTQSALVRAGATNAVILADGASFTSNDDNKAVTIGKTGSDLTTATHIDVLFRYAIELTAGNV